MGALYLRYLFIRGGSVSFHLLSLVYLPYYDLFLLILVHAHTCIPVFLE